MASSNITINLLILLALISQLFSQSMIELKEEGVEYSCSNYNECSKKYYIDISSYKNDLLTLNLYFSTPAQNIDLSKLYKTVSDDLYAECKSGGYIAYTYYESNDKRMHAHYHLNVTAKNQYLIFYRSPVGNYFPLYMSYRLKVVQKDYYKEKSTSDIVLDVICTIIGVIMLIGICICVKKVCQCCCESSSGGGGGGTYGTYGGTYAIIRLD